MGGMMNGGTGMDWRDRAGAGAAGATQQSWSMWDMMGQRLLLADARGSVIADSQGELVGQVLPARERAQGESILVAGQPVGTVLVASSISSPGSLAGQFLSSVNRSIWLAVFAAGALALAFGSLLFFQITAPIRRLNAAARAIATGDLSQRVAVNSRDELGELAHSFNDMAESLSRAEGERRQMIADVAHELRTPLSVMQANLEAMQDGVLPLDAEQIASLHEETALLTRLVADLRLLSLAEAGQLTLERAEVDPAEIVSKAAERLRPRAEEKGVQLQVQVPAAALPPVLADADRISQVIGNLIGNALRYTAEGGLITVAAGSPSQDKRQAQTVMITVTDSGTGIPAADLPHIFDRFYRADKSRTRISGGSGLGLAIVKYIVEAHGGRVWTESPVFQDNGRAGHGARISFTLPTTHLSSPGA